MTRGLGTSAFRLTACLARLVRWIQGSRALVVAVIAVALSASTVSAQGTVSAQERTLDFYNIHTKETVSVTFKRNGRYDSSGLRKLDQFMRDWRLNIVTRIDPELYDLLWELKTEFGLKVPIKLISGHRSAKTNNMLRRTRGGQAKKSLHVKGSAADVYFPDVPLKRLRNAALVKQRGGVGYYPRSGQPFVHIDTGRVRHWPRIPRSQLAAILKGGSSGIPVRRVRETAIARLEAPTPQVKPSDALTRQPAPFRLASLVSEKNPEPPAATGVTAIKPDEYRPGDWGESWLTPSRPTANPSPRLKPMLVAQSAPGLRLSTNLAPSNVVGYAPPGGTQTNASGRLLNGSSTTLASMLANAERLSALSSLGAEPQPGDNPSANMPMVGSSVAPNSEQPDPMRQDIQNQQPDRDTSSRPIYTASLAPRNFLPPRDTNRGRFRAVLFAPAHQLVFEPSPRIAQTLTLGVDGLKALAFSGGLFAVTEVGAFSPVRDKSGIRVSSLRVVEAGNGSQNALMAFARRAYNWLTGS